MRTHNLRSPLEWPYALQVARDHIPSLDGRLNWDSNYPLGGWFVNPRLGGWCNTGYILYFGLAPQYFLYRYVPAKFTNRIYEPLPG